jgi:hypothetical protein
MNRIILAKPETNNNKPFKELSNTTLKQIIKYTPAVTKVNKIL